MALKSISLAPGECIVLPAGAVIDSVIATGDAAATSTCGVLPAPSSYKCGVFYLNVDDDANDNHPNDEETTMLSWIKVGSTTYTLNELASSVSLGTLNLHITDLAIFQFTYISRYVIDDPGDNKRKAVYLYFQVPESLFDSLQLKITSNEGMDTPPVYYLLPSERVCGEY